eukprot:scaffold34591_cov121-Skeletonema_dohrnii-CCMP3373.AAC.1
MMSSVDHDKARWLGKNINDGAVAMAVRINAVAIVWGSSFANPGTRPLPLANPLVPLANPLVPLQSLRQTEYRRGTKKNYQVQALDLSVGSCSLLSLHSLHALKGYCGCGGLYSTKKKNNIEWLRGAETVWVKSMMRTHTQVARREHL